MIQSIEILKRFRAAEKYGEKGKAGVIEFYLKNANVTDKNDPAGSAYKKVETESVFPGGEQAWRNFITKNLNASAPANKGAPEGTYTVVIKFVLDRNGVISDITPLTSHGYGMEEEAIRVISKGANWEPAMQNGRPVKTYRKQPVTFQVSGQDWFKISTTRIPAGKSTLVEIKEMDYVKDEDIEVTVSEGTVTYDSGKKYFIKADKPGRIFLTVTKKAKKKKNQLDYGTTEITVE